MGAKFSDDYPDELELKVTEEEDRTIVEARLEQTAEQCYRLFSDADHIAEWLVVVGTVVVRRRDDRGRALEVDFLGSLERASVAYTLSYEYDDPQLEVRWRHGGGSLKRLAGSARFLPDGEHCRLRYTLATEQPRGLPPWADELYRARPAETVVLDFCEWLDRRHSRL